MIKQLSFYLIMLAIMLAVLELFAFVAAKLIDQDDFFDARHSVYARLTEENLAAFKAGGADAITGWHSWGPRVREEDNCLGQPVEYSYDAAGARVFDGFDAAGSKIIIVGDSYTNGDEAPDNETYPAVLSRKLGVSVANHGVGGYDPTQSLLNLQQQITRYPQAKVAVLGIMYENVYRMVNSYRPVLYATSSDFTLKPYMAGGMIVPHPGSQVFDSLEVFRKTADLAFDNDFWAKPRAEFPYLLALGKSLHSNYFLYRKLQKTLRKVGMPEFQMVFADEEIQRNLVALLNQFADLSQQWGVEPVVVFIPRNELDTSSASSFIDQNHSQLDDRLVIGDVARARDVDWMKFNLREEHGDNICHPSAYGYSVIAEYIAGLLRENGVWPD